VFLKSVDDTKFRSYKPQRGQRKFRSRQLKIRFSLGKCSEDIQQENNLKEIFSGSDNQGAKKFLQGLQCDLVARKINETLAAHAKKKCHIKQERSNS